MTFGASFENAAFVFWAGFFYVFTGQVDFDPGEIGVEALEEVVDIGPDGIGEFGVHGDVAIAVDLNLHPLLLFVHLRGLDAVLGCRVAGGRMKIELNVVFSGACSSGEQEDWHGR